MSFFGGEPLLQFPAIKEFICEYISELDEAKTALPNIDISTNGTLVTEEMAQFFKKYKIKLALSLDGPKEINDMGRFNNNSEYSVSDAVRCTIELLEKFQVKYHIQMVIHKGHLENYQTGMAVKWLEEFDRPNCIGVTLSPVVTNDTRFKIEGEEMVKNLERVAKDLTRNYMEQMLKPDAHIPSLEMIDPLLHIVKNSYHGDCHAGYSVCIEPDGSIYPCQMFCGNDEYKLGNVFDEFFDDKKARKLLNVKRQDCESCKECIAKGVCTFWCKGLQNLENGGLNKPFSFRCRFQRAIVIECIRGVAALKPETEEYRNFFVNMKKLFGSRE